MNDNINITEFIDFFINNKKDVIVNNSYNLDYQDTITLKYEPRNLKFDVTRDLNLNPTKYAYSGYITKIANNAEYNGGIYIEINENDYNRLKNTFIFTKVDLISEVQSMLRGDKIDNILNKDKDE